MNIYICSTVRHLLFAICRSIHENQQRHHVVFFPDYQDTSLSGWDLSQLPDNIHIHQLLRADIRTLLQSTLAGRVSYLCAMRKLPAPKWLQQPIIQTLKSVDPELASALAVRPIARLWLFNERNKMARLFRLLVPHFSNIEEGEGNYLEERLLWRKALPRALKGLPARYRVIGDNPRCDEIWVIHPERLPPLVRIKGRQIDFLDGPEIVNMLARVFEDNISEESTGAVILATQPLEGLAGLNIESKQRIYAQIVAYFKSHGREVILKNHPAENSADYQFLSDKTIVAQSKIPVEGLILGSHEPRLLVSIFSTAGLGFEKFCRRIKLCNGEYRDTVATIQTWAGDADRLEKTLQAIIRPQLEPN